MAKTLWIGVEVFGLLVQDAHVFTTQRAAYDWFQEYTGMPYPENEAELEFLGQSCYDQTRVFEVILAEDEKG